jgi:hypothetical protein
MRDRAGDVTRRREGWMKRALVVAMLAALAAGCGGSAPTAEQLNASYEHALERTAGRAVELPGGDAGARAALSRAEALFSDMKPETVRERTLATYAEDAYLNDNLVALEGAQSIAGYFARTVANVSAIEVAFLDVSHSGPEYYARWRMTVTSDRLDGGAPVVSHGVTHFRFDADGRILVHKDFWDAGTGLYEHVPVLGLLLRAVRGSAGG